MRTKARHSFNYLLIAENWEQQQNVVPHFYFLFCFCSYFFIKSMPDCGGWATRRARTTTNEEQPPIKAMALWRGSIKLKWKFCNGVVVAFGSVKVNWVQVISINLLCSWTINHPKHAMKATRQPTTSYRSFQSQLDFWVAIDLNMWTPVTKMYL